MGGEGHMMDMIQKMKLNREQRKNSRDSSFKGHKKPILSKDSFKNIHHIKDIPQPERLSPEQAKKYRMWSIVLLIAFIGIIGSLLLIIITSN